MTKIYGIYGFTQAKIQVPIGSGAAYLMLEFTKGNTQPGPYYRPATYVSASRTEQQMIENSPIFGHKIILYKSFGEEEVEQPKTQNAPNPLANPVPKVAKPAEPSPAPTQEKTPAPEMASYPDVTNIDEARVVLKSAGAKATQLASEDAMKKFMEKKNIVFPNFNF